MRVRFIAVLLLTISLTSLAFAQSPEPDFDAITQAIEEQMQAQNIPGLAIAIVHRGEVIYAEGFGVRSTEDDAPVTPDTLFRIGSTTKPLTALAVLRLVEQGLLDLDTPITAYLPEFTMSDDITLRQLLGHTAGLNDRADAIVLLDANALRDSVLGFTSAGLFAPSGTVRSYANPGFDIAGAVVEAVSGQPFADAMAKDVFAPMGMTRTTFHSTVAMTYPLASGHQPNLFGLSVVRPNPDNITQYPSGFAFSTVNDLTHLIDFLLEGDEGFLSEALRAEMLDSSPVRVASPFDYGLGVVRTTYRGAQQIGHGGRIDGYGAFLETLPEYDFGVAIVANNGAIDEAPIFAAVVDAVLGLPVEDVVLADDIPYTSAEYVGTYVLRALDGEPVASIVISEQDGALVAQADGQPLLTLRPTAPDSFGVYFGDINAGIGIDFVRDENGRVAYVSVGYRIGVREG
jgi:CubicO group peptidase (beta-lactamase class C family)